MMQKIPPLLWLLLLLLALVSGCSGVGRTLPEGPMVRYGAVGDDLFSRYAPVVMVENPHAQYNRIGQVAARRDEQGAEQLYIDTQVPAYYLQQQAFSTERGDYTNLIYRFHFTEVPNLRLTAGDNVGMIVIITLDAQQRPLLITTVHSCGCYLGMVPTSYLDPQYYPSDWPAEQQQVFGERLPARLDYPAEFNPSLRPVIYLRDATHRVMDIQLLDVAHHTHFLRVAMLPMDQLYQVPLAGEDATTAFFYLEGRNQGYVKGSSKPWERLLMSWWAFDWNIGVDKALGDPEQTGAVFYTSLKPWARDESNLWDFAGFLRYWGWGL